MLNLRLMRSLVKNSQQCVISIRLYIPLSYSEISQPTTIPIFPNNIRKIWLLWESLKFNSCW
jgi:hypothetical protein